MSTPVNPGPRVNSQQNDRWGKALDSFDKTRPIELKLKCDDKGNPAVILRREYDTQMCRAVWSKQYRKNGYYDLRAFNEHEKNLVSLLCDAKHSYHMISSMETSQTYIAKMSGADKVSASPEAELKTTDQGSSLSTWAQLPIEANGIRHDHVFRLPGHYLRLARGALIALEEVHSTGIVHLDLNLGNWCLGAKFELLFNGNDRVRLTPDWNEINIIDVGYSYHPSVPPKTLLPYDQDKVSKVMQQALQAAEAAGLRAFSLLSPAVKTRYGWFTFKNAQYKPSFWTTHASIALDAFRKLDWREDYWKLGNVLAELRGGRAKIDAPQKRSARETQPYSAIGAVNEFIGSPDDPEHCGLAEELIAWGTATTLYDSEKDPAARIAAARSLREATHAALLKRIDETIALLAKDDDAAHVFVYRRELDSGYPSAQANAKAQDDMRKAQEAQAERDKLAARTRYMKRAKRAGFITASLAIGLVIGNYALERMPGLPWQGWQGSDRIALPPSPSRADTQTEYKTEVDRMTDTAWFKNSFSQTKTTPTNDQTAWIKKTIVLANEQKLPRAQWILGILHCGYAHPTLVVHNTQQCGTWLARALTNSMLATDLNATEISRWNKDAADLFDRLTLPRAGPTDKVFAEALLPGLAARASDDPELGLRYAYTLACVVAPPNTPAAIAALTAVLGTPSKPALHDQTRQLTQQLKNGDYSSCLKS